MNLCSSIVDEVTCPFQDQSLLIFDQKVKLTSKTAVTSTQGTKYPVAHSIGALVAMERSSSHWQLYLGTKFRARDHLSIPTVLLPGIIRSINLSRSQKELPEINFSFISSRLQICKLPEFGFYYALIQSEEISHLLRTTAIATTHTLARKNSPGGIRKNSKRGKTVTFNQGLQTASAHSQYLGRWNMMTNGKPIPSVKTINISTEKEKRDSILLHHLSIELCKSKFGVSPFEIPDTFS